MGTFSIWHWLVVLAVVLLFFGAGRLPTVMGDLAKGIKNFKAGMKEGDQPDDEAVAREEPKALPGERSEAATRSEVHRDEAARG